MNGDILKIWLEWQELVVKSWTETAKNFQTIFTNFWPSTQQVPKNFTDMCNLWITSQEKFVNTWVNATKNLQSAFAEISATLPTKDFISAYNSWIDTVMKSFDELLKSFKTWADTTKNLVQQMQNTMVESQVPKTMTDLYNSWLNTMIKISEKQLQLSKEIIQSLGEILK